MVQGFCKDGARCVKEKAQTMGDDGSILDRYSQYQGDTTKMAHSRREGSSLLLPYPWNFPVIEMAP
jgi:hypothetical protein